jgi:6-phosphogluconate dehydrogenase
MPEWDAIILDAPDGTHEASAWPFPAPQAITATTNAASCGHFVNLVRDGIDYGLLQLLSEIFDLLHRTVALNDDELRRTQAARHLEALQGYLTEISPTLSHPLPDGAERNDLAAQLAGTARRLAVEIPTMTAGLSLQEPAARQRRQALARTLSRQPVQRLQEGTESVLAELHGAFVASMIITYAEGFALLAAASAPGGLPYDLVQIARLWKGGGSLRSPLLEDIALALEATPNLPNLLCDDDLSEKLMEHQEYLRRAVWRAHQADFLTPGMLAALDHMDSRREAWWPINLIQVPPRQRVPLARPA